MISAVKNDSDMVIAYAEWRQVGQSGFDKLGGEYIYIAELWIRDRNQWWIFRELMYDILRKAKEAKWLYFRRRKYDDKQSKNYSREQVMRLLGREPIMVLREVA